ncbi:hypothetical protein GCM10009119_18660 [Algoriphagus jejuensis]|uniref:DUF481 domain-containing protein n=1 Tax=Algoriphagus jejuensis TaxID=419934 RepID=A0ABP3YD60_9BACT
MFNLRFQLVFLSTLFALTSAIAQDSLYTRYGDLLIGKVEKISAEKIYFKTAYRSSAVDIKLTEIAKVSSSEGFLLNDTKNKNWRGELVLDSANHGVVGIRTPDSLYFFDQKEVFELTKDQKKRFKDRFTLGINLGYIRAKTDNTLALSLGLNSRYRTRRWDTRLDYQDYGAAIAAEIVGRTSLDYSLAYILPKEWFVNGKANLFSSTEQRLDIRRTLTAGGGRYLIHREAKVLSFSGGVLSNHEVFTDNPQTFASVEGDLTSHFYGKIGGHVDLTTDWGLFPSFTDRGRVRNTLNLDLKYLFLSHFNVGIHYMLNTDNKPPLETSKRDYVFEVKLGWTLHKR